MRRRDRMAQPEAFRSGKTWLDEDAVGVILRSWFRALPEELHGGCDDADPVDLDDGVDPGSADPLVSSVGPPSSVTGLDVDLQAPIRAAFVAAPDVLHLLVRRDLIQR
jgi:hypothetical protein